MQRRAVGAKEGAEGPADEVGGLCRGGQQALRKGQRALVMREEVCAEEGSRR